jgi:alpha-tubulin suppressor-like RCC1 family protein
VTGATAIASGGFHSCAIVTGGTVRCWGDDGAGQLGDGLPGDKNLVSKLVSGITTSNPAVAIGAGEFFTCALLTDDTVKCWGHNGFGQLGDGTKVDRSTPAAVVGLPAPAEHPVVALTVGYSHACVLLHDLANDELTTRCWGGNVFGQLGHKTPDGDDEDDFMDPSTTPLEVQYDTDSNPLAEDLQKLSGVTAISAGQFHTCALVAGGNGRCWGQGGRGQLGTDPDPNPLPPELDYSSSAVPVSGLEGASAITAGGFHSCALVGSGMQCWGYNFHGQLGSSADYSRIPVQVTAVAGATMATTGSDFNCALVDTDLSNKPMCWGDNTDGRIGANLSVADTTIRTPVSGIASAATIDAGNGHTCALPTGSLTPMCWGLNTNGQLGNGTNTSSSVPIAVSGLTDAITISAGGALGTAERGHTCATRSNTKVACWGRNGNHQLGADPNTSTTDFEDSNLPIMVQVDSDPDPDVTTLVDLTGASDAVAGGFHSCAKVASNAWCWGLNNDGQLGDATTEQRSSATRVQVDTDPDVDDPLTGVATLVAGRSHTCALMTDGTVKCWGDNSRGQLGNGGAPTDGIPVPVAGITTDNRATAITAGELHTCVRLVDGSMKCWGGNDDGQVGNGTTDVATTPTQVSDSTTTDVSFGPTGDKVPDELLPIIRSISAGRQNTCAVLIDKSVYCWGDNAHGQLGDGIGPTSVNPVTVENLGAI